MPLRHEPDTSLADWIVTDVGDDDDAWTRVLQGPPGFEAYATIWFDDETADPYRADAEVVAIVTRLAGAFTTTPDQVRFALWEGWGELEGGRQYTAMQPMDWFGRVFRPAAPHRPAPAFPADVLAAPRVDLHGWRSYLLFTGAADEAGDWGARPPAPGWPSDLPQASLTWPADRAWCLTSDVDPDWCCLGGSQRLVDTVLARPDLRSEPAVHGTPPPLPA